MKDNKKGKIKFIRRNGKIIPIRADGGADLRSSPKYDKKLTKDVIKKHGRQATTGEKVKRAAATFLGGSMLLGGYGLIGGALAGGALGNIGRGAGKALQALGRKRSSISLMRAGKKTSNAFRMSKVNTASGASLGGKIGVGASAVLAVTSLASNGPKVISDRKYNKEFGKAYIKKLKGSSV